MTDIVVPAEQEGTKAVVKTWLKKLGDRVQTDEPIVELETDKVAVEIAATSDGVLAEVCVIEGEEVEPGTLLGRIATGAGGAADRRPAPELEPPAHAANRAERASEGRLPPGIRKLLDDNGLDAADVPRAGERLTREDILSELKRREAASPPPSVGSTRIPHDSMRRRIAEHMAQSVRTAPHVTAVFEADFTAIIAHRARHRQEFEATGANLTLTTYFIAASVAAMKVSPQVNARWFDDYLEVFDDINIGIGTALGERGLIVPVIHRAQTLSLLDVAKRLTDVTERARSGKLTAADVRNGTFSISNHGVSGSLVATPIIINQPQSAILGIGKLQKRAVVRESNGGDAIEVRPMAYVSLTIDHRAIDAFQTNAWLSCFVNALESWPLT